jgi:peptide/nickel transport system ATP-binding protein
MSASAAASDVLLSVEGLSKLFRTRRGTVRAAEDVSFAVKRGSIVGLVGESGSGKTTVGRTLLRLTEPTGGRAMFDGVDLFALPARDMQAYRRRLQIVFQDPMSSLNPRLRVGDIVGEGLQTLASCRPAGAASASPNCWRRSACVPSTQRGFRTNSPAASANASASRGRWPWSPTSSSPTSRSRRSTCRCRRRSST